MDLIGPWTVQVRGIPHMFDALTVINTVTNLVEIVRIDCKTSDQYHEEIRTMMAHTLSVATTLYT